MLSPDEEPSYINRIDTSQYAENLSSSTEETISDEDDTYHAKHSYNKSYTDSMNLGTELSFNTNDPNQMRKMSIQMQLVEMINQNMITGEDLKNAQVMAKRQSTVRRSLVKNKTPRMSQGGRSSLVRASLTSRVSKTAMSNTNLKQPHNKASMLSAHTDLSISDDGNHRDRGDDTRSKKSSLQNLKIEI